MKLTSILILLLASLASLSNSRGDGDIVAANTRSSSVTIDLNGVVQNAGNTSSSGIYVEILYQPYLSSTAPNEFSPFNSYGWTEVPTPLRIGPIPGRIVSTPLTLAGIPNGANVWLEAVAWNNNAISLTDALSGTSSYYGISAAWSQATGGFDTPLAPVSTGPYFPDLELTPYVYAPEVGQTLAFFAIGICGLFAFFRRTRFA